MDAPIEAHELFFVAPIPRGHDVVIVTLTDTGVYFNNLACALDETAGILYCGEDLFDTFGRQVMSVTDPGALLAKLGRPALRTTKGRVVGSIVSTKHDGDANFTRTRLFLQPTTATSPYR